MAKIGIVTVTYNSGEVLDEFMESILKQNHDDWILYVIDNDSKDSTLEVLAKYPDNRVVIVANKENYGVAKGNNQGIELALSEDCDYVLLINNDTVFDRDLFTNLVVDIESLNADIVSPKIMYHDKPNTIWFGGARFSKLIPVQPVDYYLNSIDSGQCNAPIQCEFTTTCCAIFKSEIFNIVGLMDEKFFVYIDDGEWMYRAAKLKIKIFLAPRSILFHKVSSLTGGGVSEFGLRMYHKNIVYFMRKHYTGIRFIAYISYFLSLTIFKLLINRIKWKHSKVIVTSLVAGFKL